MVNPFGSFGGILNKKKPEEKKVGGMKNIFSNWFGLNFKTLSLSSWWILNWVNSGTVD